MNKRQLRDAKDCEEMQEIGEDKECLGCSCNTCVARIDTSEDKLNSLLGAIANHDKEVLLIKANHLKQSDGEGWAIGEMVVRALKLMSQ